MIIRDEKVCHLPTGTSHKENIVIFRPIHHRYALPGKDEDPAVTPWREEECARYFDSTLGHG
jgi:hypothetical protein